MFRVTVNVQDQKLHRVLWALAGLIVGKPEIDPLRLEGTPNETDTPIDGALIQLRSSPKQGSLASRVLQSIILDRKPDTPITTKVVRDAIREAGGAVGSWSGVTKTFRDRGVMTGPNNNIFTLNAAAASEFLAASGAGTLPAKEMSIKRATKPGQRKPVSETLPGQIMRQLLDKGTEKVTQPEVSKILKSLGKDKGQAWSIMQYLKKYELVDERDKYGAYKLRKGAFEAIVRKESEGVQ